MPEENGVSLEVDATSAATGEQTAIDSSATETVETQTQTVTDDTQASTETAETTQEAKADVDDPKIPSQFREHLKELESDIKVKYKPAMAGLEKAATDLYGANTPEDVQATIQTVQALAPTLKVLTDPQASQADVVAAVQKMLPQEHVEAVAWAALNDPATQDVIFSDPEVLQTISEKLFGGKSVEEINAILANAPVAEVDPEREAWKKERSDFQAERQRERLQSEQVATQKRTQEFADRFYDAPAQRVLVDDCKLAAPEGANEADKKMFEFAAKAAKFTAQALFIEQNMAAAEQVQNLYASGKSARASADAIKSEIGLANRYEATLLKTGEFFANLLKSRSIAAVNGQQDKINGVRPDVTGSVDGTNGNHKEAPYDPDDPGFMQRFARDVNPRLHN